MVICLINELKKYKRNFNIKKICSMNHNSSESKRPDIEIDCDLNGNVSKIYLDITFTCKKDMKSRYQAKM